MGIEKFKDQELKDVVRSIRVYEGRAKDSGNVYYALDLHLTNGYTKRLFLNNEESFAWINALELLDTDKQIQGVF